MNSISNFEEELSLQCWADHVLSFVVRPHFLLGLEKEEEEKKEVEKEEEKEQEQTINTSGKGRRQRKVAPSSEEICEEVAAALNSTAFRKLTKKERTVLTRFCAHYEIPVISRDGVIRYMGDAAKKVVRSDTMNKFVSEEHELTYPGCLKVFHGLLLEAKDLQALAHAQGTRRLVGIFLEMPSLVTNIASLGP